MERRADPVVATAATRVTRTDRIVAGVKTIDAPTRPTPPVAPPTPTPLPPEPSAPVPRRLREPDWGDFLWTHEKADGSNTSLCGLTNSWWIRIPWILTCPRCRAILEAGRRLAR
jgi:hypothetical protein